MIADFVQADAQINDVWIPAWAGKTNGSCAVTPGNIIDAVSEAEQKQCRQAC